MRPSHWRIFDRGLGLRFSLTFIAAVLSASLVFAQSPQSDERANPQQAQAPGGQDTNPEPAHPPPITASEHKPEGGGDNKEHECRYNGPRWFAGFYCFFAEHEKFWVSFGTIILAAVTLILGAATVFLYRATRDLVRGADKTSERQLRAYVCVQRSKIRNFPPDEEITEFVQAHIIAKNTGQTPAYQVISWIGIGLDEFPPQQAPSDPIMDRQARSVIGPGGELHLTVFLNQRLDPKHLAALSAGTHALRVIGKIDYLDAFGKARWTRFNLFYGGSYGLNTGLALNHGPDGNEAT